MNKVFSLNEYALMAIATLLHSDIDAEVVYTDIEPDVVLSANDDDYTLDIDDNGIEDFLFSKMSGVTIGWTASSSNYFLHFLNICRAQPFDAPGIAPIKNEIAGYTFSTYFSYYANWPFALSEGNLINSDLEFHNELFQTMARREGAYPDNGTGFGSGYWWSNVEDRYLGVNFVDADSLHHFGWVRCSVIDSAEVLIIKDFAYETIPDQPIIAGDTLSYVNIHDSEIAKNANIYAFNKLVYIRLNQMGFQDITVSDMAGKIIIKQPISNLNTTIIMANYPAGVYIVTLLNGADKFSQKVSIL